MFKHDKESYKRVTKFIPRPKFFAGMIIFLFIPANTKRRLELGEYMWDCMSIDQLS